MTTTKRSRFFFFFLKPCWDPGVSEGNSLCSAHKRTVEQRVNWELNTSQGRVDKIFPVWFHFWFGLVASYFGLFRPCHSIISTGFLDTLGNNWAGVAQFMARAVRGAIKPLNLNFSCRCQLHADNRVQLFYLYLLQRKSWFAKLNI